MDIKQVGAICDVVREATVTHKLLYPTVSTKADTFAVVRNREDNGTLIKKRETLTMIRSFRDILW